MFESYEGKLTDVQTSQLRQQLVYRDVEEKRNDQIKQLKVGDCVGVTVLKIALLLMNVTNLDFNFKRCGRRSLILLPKNDRQLRLRMRLTCLCLHQTSNILMTTLPRME